MRRFLERLLVYLTDHVRGMLVNPMNVGAAAIVEQAGRIVQVRQSYQSGWLLPGGGGGRGEPPAFAVIRELEEEIGLTQSAPPLLFGVFVRRWLWVTNVTLIYRVRDAVFTFKPNWEIREVKLVDPANPPPGTHPATRRRLKELLDEAPPSPYW